MIHYKSSNQMTEVADESVQLVITSPPYPMIEKWDASFRAQSLRLQLLGELPRHSSGLGIYAEMLRLLGVTWKECYRVLCQGGILCINIGDATRRIDKTFQCFPNYAWTVVMCQTIGFTPLIPIFWKKISTRPNAFLGSGFLPINGYVSQDHEYIALFRKGSLRSFTAEEKLRRTQSTFTKAERDVWFSQVWTIPGRAKASITSAWPDEIPYRLMRMFSIIGDTVLDPFCGSGDEALCVSIGRNYIGYTLR